MKNRLAVLVMPAVLTVLACFPQPAAAIQIRLIRMNSGAIPGGGNFQNETPDHVHSDGCGDPNAATRTAAVMNEAASYWEQIFPGDNDYTLTIRWGFSADMGGGAGTTGLQMENGRVKEAYIHFDDVDHYVYPFDSNCMDWGPEDMRTEAVDGVNTQYYWRSPRGDARQYLDLLSMAMHEIAHALGLNSKMVSDSATSIVTTEPRPHPGYEIAIERAGGVHLDTGAFSLMKQGLTPGVHREPSTVDVMAVAEAGQYTEVADFILNQ